MLNTARGESSAHTACHSHRAATSELLVHPGKSDDQLATPESLSGNNIQRATFSFASTSSPMLPIESLIYETIYKHHKDILILCKSLRTSFARSPLHWIMCIHLYLPSSPNLFHFILHCVTSRGVHEIFHSLAAANLRRPVHANASTVDCEGPEISQREETPFLFIENIHHEYSNINRIDSPHCF